MLCCRGWAATEFQKSDKSSTDVTRPGGGGGLYTHYYILLLLMIYIYIYMSVFVCVYNTCIMHL